MMKTAGLPDIAGGFHQCPMLGILTSDTMSDVQMLMPSMLPPAMSLNTKSVSTMDLLVFLSCL